MKPMNPVIEKDLEALSEDYSIFPEQMRKETLEFVAENEELEITLRNLAIRELTIRSTGIQIYGIMASEVTEEESLESWSDAPTTGTPAFAYSVGAERVGLPELLSFYPSHPTNHWVINTLYQQMLDLKVDLPTTPGEVKVINGILEDLPIKLELLDEDKRKWSYDQYTCQVKSIDTPILHIIMPTPKGDWIDSYIPDEMKS